MTIEVAFFGALGRDAERKVSSSGKDYLRLNVRVGDGDGTQWLSVMVFEPQAIGAADKLVKGVRVYVEGRLTANAWTASDGTKRLGLSVMSNHCRLTQIGRNGRPAKSAADRKLSEPYSPTASFDDAIPF